LVALLGAAACGGSSEPAAPPSQVEAPPALPVELLKTSWPVLTADNAVREPYEKEPGWVKLVIKRDYRAAVKQLGGDGGLAGARAHAEAAAMYRQAALLAANSLVSTYADEPKDEDPIGVAHLLTVAYAIRGETDKVREQHLRLKGVDLGDMAAWDAPWSAWLDAGAAWPPDLSALPVALPELAPGEWPAPPTSSNYTLDYNLPPSPDGAKSHGLDVTDPSTLLALSFWHDRVAHLAAADASPVIDTYSARYRLAPEAPVTGKDLPMEFLFGSDMLVPGDGPFFADLFGAKGADAVEAHASTSIIAALASAARVDGKVHPEKATDLAAALRRELIEQQKTIAGGSTQGHHRIFGDIAQVAALRGLAFVAQVEGNKEVSGVLRIQAMERSGEEHTACPTAALSLAAWDANNRYHIRPTESLHNLVRRYPTLEIARFSLDVLALRISLGSSGSIAN